MYPETYARAKYGDVGHCVGGILVVRHTHRGALEKEEGEEGREGRREFFSLLFSFLFFLRRGRRVLGKRKERFVVCSCVHVRR